MVSTMKNDKSVPKKSVPKKTKKSVTKTKKGVTEKTKKPRDLIFTLIDNLKVHTPKEIEYSSDHGEPDSDDENYRREMYRGQMNSARKASDARPKNLQKFKAELEDKVQPTDVNKKKNKTPEEFYKGYTPLLYAIEKEHDDDVIEMLLNRDDIDVNKSLKLSYAEYTPLSRAIFAGKTNVVKLLLQHKDLNVNKPASVISRNFVKETPIFTAVMGGHKEIVEMLAQDQRIKNLDTSIEEARKQGRTDIVKLLTKYI